MNGEQHIICRLCHLARPIGSCMENFLFVAHALEDFLRSHEGFGRPATHEGKRASLSRGNTARDGRIHKRKICSTSCLVKLTGGRGINGARIKHKRSRRQRGEHTVITHHDRLHVLARWQHRKDNVSP